MENLVVKQSEKVSFVDKLVDKGRDERYENQ